MRKSAYEKITPFFVIHIMLLCMPMPAYSGHWTAYTIVDGLAGGNVRSMIVDGKGNLWIATDGDGVSRYDGESFQNFTTADGLAGNFVRAILEDTRGNLWFATWGGGVCKYDGQGFVITLDAEDGLASDFVTSIAEDRAGNLWFGTAEGVSKYDGRTFVNFRTEHGLVHNYVRSILEDSEGNLWFGTACSGISKYDGNTFENFTIGPDLEYNDVRAILEDGAGNLWFATERCGIRRYDGKRFENFTTAQGLAHNEVWTIFEDKAGNLWFGTQSGVSKYDGKSFRNWTSREGLVGTNVSAIVEDREGNLWFGTWGDGICKYDDRIQRYLTEREGIITDAHEADNGDLWFITEKGEIIRYDGEIFHNYLLENGLTNHRMNKIVPDREGNLWFGGLGCITRYDGKAFRPVKDDGLIDVQFGVILGDSAGRIWFGVWKHGTTITIGRYDGESFRYFPETGNLGDKTGNEVKAALEDKAGNLWFGTRYSGVYKYDGNRFVNLTMADGLAGNYVSSIVEDATGRIWFGIRGNDMPRPSFKASGGLNVYDGARFLTYSSKKDGLGSDSVTSILKDRKGNLWFGTWHGGVSRYDGAGFQTFTTRDGLASNTILSILEDREGNLWFGSQGAGVSKYDGESFQTLTTADGLINDTAFVALADRKGNLWFQYEVPGLTKYTPSRNTEPFIRITQVVADKKYPANDEVKVPSKAHIVFQYKGVTLNTRFNNIRYVYKLEGYDDTWSRPTPKRESEFDNLRPGTYVFKVRAIDRDLNQSHPPASLKLVVLPPFYMRPKFAVPTVVVALFLIYGFWIFVSKFYAQRKIAAELRDNLRRQEELDRERIRRELQAAHDLQMGLMPESPPKLAGFDAFGRCKPASEVGGDLFEYILLGQEGNQLAIALTDVCGKGLIPISV